MGDTREKGGEGEGGRVLRKERRGRTGRREVGSIAGHVVLLLDTRCGTRVVGLEAPSPGSYSKANIAVTATIHHAAKTKVTCS